MEHAESRRLWQFMILLLLAGSLGCQPSTGKAPIASSPAASSGPQSVSREEAIVFGPGSLAVPDMRVGLDKASAYESKLTTSFDGTRAGQPLKWSQTYTYEAIHEPLSRQLFIKSSGDGTTAPDLMLEFKGVAYEKAGEEACTANLIDAGNSALADLEPAAQLPSLFGAEEAGTEKVNGVQAAHYTFDERALGEAGLSKSTGELWLASEGGYVLRYRQTTTGDAGYFGDETEGTLTREYELSKLNKPLTVELPADCPPGLIDVPTLPDATGVASLPGLLKYETASSVKDVVDFYAKALPALGWMAKTSSAIPEGISAEEYQKALEALKAMGLAQATPTADPNPTEAYFVFTQGDQMLQVSATRTDAATQVALVVAKGAK